MTDEMAKVLSKAIDKSFERGYNTGFAHGYDRAMQDLRSILDKHTCEMQPILHPSNKLARAEKLMWEDDGK